MKVSVILRTLNEERNIIRFCRSYAQADEILIADGGSYDRTIRIARMFDNVQVRPFDTRIDFKGTIFNNQPAQLNYLIDWAIDERADWIIYDDCDCVPTGPLRHNMRSILANAQSPVVCSYRLYVWGDAEYLPRMSIAGHSLWAWRPDEVPEIRGDESVRPGRMGIVGVPLSGSGGYIKLNAPFCLMHIFAPDIETWQLKMRRYAARGDPQDLKGSYWPPEPLPEWAEIDLYGAGDGRIKPPDVKLCLVKTNIVRCEICHSKTRALQWSAGQCETCGSPVIVVKESRPIGPGSIRWSELQREFYEMLELFAPDPVFLEWFLNTVVIERKGQ